jgi:uncharacterized membrane protein YeaQ/YmgE (transglycosylase-associated protein family)
METPLLNFVAAIGIGLIIGIIGGFIVKGRNPSATWLAPVLALVGTLIASGLALAFGDQRDYGWKEATLQVVLALVGVGLAAVLGSKSAGTASTSP